MRGGLDDALDKLARRDELRRRAAGEATGTPPAVQELVEAIAAVVNRNPTLAVTVGVEGAGDPILLHFAFEDGVVQVNADNTVAARVADAAPTSPKHADFDIDLDDTVDEPPPYTYPETAAHPPRVEKGQKTRRISYDDRDRYDPGTGYTSATYDEETPTTAASSYPDEPFFAGPAASDRRYEATRRHVSAEDVAGQPPRNGGSASSRSRESAGPARDGGPYPPHPFAATPPPPVPPQTTRNIHAEQHRAPEEPSAAERMPNQRFPEHATQRAMPAPLPEPIPLKVDTEETELAAKRLAALLRDNPSLLRQSPQD